LFVCFRGIIKFKKFFSITLNPFNYIYKKLLNDEKLDFDKDSNYSLHLFDCIYGISLCLFFTQDIFNAMKHIEIYLKYYPENKFAILHLGVINSEIDKNKSLEIFNNLIMKEEYFVFFYFLNFFFYFFLNLIF
jgi:hypothetical protein